MTRITREEFVIVSFDMIITLLAFWLTSYFLIMPQWYWVVLSVVVWVVVSCVSGKLKFGQYKRIRYALVGILTINVITGIALGYFYCFFIWGFNCDHPIIIVIGIITLLEWMLYYSVRKLVYRKIPFFYEEPSCDEITERGVEGGVKIDVGFETEDIRSLRHIIRHQKEFGDAIMENQSVFSEKVIIIDTSNPEDVLAHKTSNAELIINTRPLNKIQHINTGLSFTNYCLPEGGVVACNCTTSSIRQERILNQSPMGINRIILSIDYLWHRVVPKIVPFKHFYYWITKGEKRSLTRVEVLGRFYRAGFEVLEEVITNGRLHVIATKVKAPIRHDKPSNGLLIRLRRVGQNGKIIGVYKFRTMHAYSEYLQPYVFKCNQLNEGGKIAEDYRVTRFGRFFRRRWIDELPMLINWLRGDLKLVGVRPLSQHYFNLYSDDMQQLRIQTKPGLIPPFYAEKETPKTLEDIQTSERRYIEAYLEKPVSTDWLYFFRAMRNIIFKGKRSM